MKKIHKFNKNVRFQANKCLNVVASVKHLLFWRGGDLKKIITRIILTDVEYGTTGSKQIKQMFELKWNYLPEGSADPRDFNSVTSMSDYDELILSQAYLNDQKSGVKGYDVGKPVISGFKNQLDQIVDISHNQRLSTFKILNGKLCGTVSRLERDLIKFGQNMSSSCVVQVTKQDLGNNLICSCLKRIIFKKLNDYFAPSNYVSKNGNPDMTKFTESDWINVYPVNRVLKFNDQNEVDENLNRCSNVPYKISIWFFYADAGRLNGKTINEITGTYVR